MAVNTPDILWLMASEVLDCVCDALTAQSSCPCPCRKCVVFGTPVVDTCCPDGQLTAFIDRLFVEKAFPQTDSGAITCSAPLGAEFVIQLVRCVPTVDDNGNAPSCEALSASAQNLYSDLYIAYRAVICCLAAYKKSRRFTMRDGRILNPLGGCAGFEIRFGIELVDPIPTI